MGLGMGGVVAGGEEFDGGVEGQVGWVGVSAREALQLLCRGARS